MALVRVRHASMFLNSKKIAECYKSDVELNSGDELQYGDEGVIGVADGATNTQVNFDMIVPVSGATVSPEQLLLAKQNVDIQSGLINGKLWDCTMRFTKAKYDSDAKTGTLNGAFTLIGGEPTIA
jgi:hypothetical protein